MNVETNELLAVWAALSSELAKTPPNLIHPSLGMRVEGDGCIVMEIRWSESGVPPDSTVCGLVWSRDMWMHKETLTSMAREVVERFRRLHVTMGSPNVKAERRAEETP